MPEGGGRSRARAAGTPATGADAADLEWIRAVLARLVATESVNPDLDPAGSGEGAAADAVEELLGRSGLETERLEHGGGRATVVGRLRGSGGGRSLMLNGHLDTVGVAGMADPFAAAEREGRLYGRGAFDMKGGLVACLAAARRLAAGPEPAGDLWVSAVADEEVASLGTRAVLERFRTDGAIVTEPTGLRLCLAHKGFTWIRVETRGRAAHGSRPELGVDANLAMGRVLEGLGSLAAELRRRPPHPLLGPPSLHVGRLEGGTAPSVYAARARAVVERRTLPGESAAGAEEEIRAVLGSVADEGVDVRQETLLSRDPFEADPGGALVACVAAAAEAELGTPPERSGEGPWMDSAFFAAAGIDTVVIGPSGAGAHSDEEWVDVASVVRLTGILERAARRWCGAPRGG